LPSSTRSERAAGMEVLPFFMLRIFYTLPVHLASDGMMKTNFISAARVFGLTFLPGG
jgi:hypothetical protein